MLVAKMLKRSRIGTNITVNGNSNQDFSGWSQIMKLICYLLMLHKTRSWDSTNSPIANLDVGSGKTFRNTRLLTVSVSGGTTLDEAAHAGRYLYVLEM